MENQEQSVTNESEVKEQLTPEQIADAKKKQMEVWEREMPYLEAQAKYFKILAEIEMAKANRSNAIVEQAHAYLRLNPPEKTKNKPVTKK